MKASFLLLAFIAFAHFSVGASGLPDAVKGSEAASILDHMAVGTLHGSLGLLGVVFFAGAVVFRLKSRSGR